MVKSMAAEEKIQSDAAGKAPKKVLDQPQKGVIGFTSAADESQWHAKMRQRRRSKRTNRSARK